MEAVIFFFGADWETEDNVLAWVTAAGGADLPGADAGAVILSAAGFSFPEAVIASTVTGAGGGGGERPRDSATRRTERIRVAFSTMTVMVAPEMVSMATSPSAPAPMTTRSNTDLSLYCDTKRCKRSSDIPTTRIGSWCSTMRRPTMRPLRSKPTSVFIGCPEYAGMRMTSFVR